MALTTDDIIEEPGLRVELINLYHLANTALAGVPSRHARKCWAADEFGKAHNTPSVRAYKAFDTILSHQLIN